VRVTVRNGSRKLTTRISNDDYLWWTKEVKRIKKKDGLIQTSLPLLLHRIAIAQLDLSQASIGRFKAIQTKNKSTS
jgi:hypothetical protein